MALNKVSDSAFWTEEGIAIFKKARREDGEYFDIQSIWYSDTNELCLNLGSISSSPTITIPYFDPSGEEKGDVFILEDKLLDSKHDNIVRIKFDPGKATIISYPENYLEDDKNVPGINPLKSTKGITSRESYSKLLALEKEKNNDGYYLTSTGHRNNISSIRKVYTKLEIHPTGFSSNNIYLEKEEGEITISGTATYDLYKRKDSIWELDKENVKEDISYVKTKIIPMSNYSSDIFTVEGKTIKYNYSGFEDTDLRTEWDMSLTFLDKDGITRELRAEKRIVLNYYSFWYVTSESSYHYGENNDTLLLFTYQSGSTNTLNLVTSKDLGEDYETIIKNGITPTATSLFVISVDKSEESVEDNLHSYKIIIETTTENSNKNHLGPYKMVIDLGGNYNPFTFYCAQAGYCPLVARNGIGGEIYQELKFSDKVKGYKSLSIVLGDSINDYTEWGYRIEDKDCLNLDPGNSTLGERAILYCAHDKTESLGQITFFRKRPSGFDKTSWEDVAYSGEITLNISNISSNPIYEIDDNDEEYWTREGDRVLIFNSNTTSHTITFPLGLIVGDHTALDVNFSFSEVSILNETQNLTISSRPTASVMNSPLGFELTSQDGILVATVYCIYLDLPKALGLYAFTKDIKDKTIVPLSPVEQSLTEALSTASLGDTIQYLESGVVYSAKVIGRKSGKAITSIEYDPSESSQKTEKYALFLDTTEITSDTWEIIEKDKDTTVSGSSSLNYGEEANTEISITNNNIGSNELTPLKFGRVPSGSGHYFTDWKTKYYANPLEIKFKIKGSEELSDIEIYKDASLSSLLEDGEPLVVSRPGIYFLYIKTTKNFNIFLNDLSDNFYFFHSETIQKNIKSFNYNNPSEVIIQAFAFTGNNKGAFTKKENKVEFSNEFISIISGSSRRVIKIVRDYIDETTGEYLLGTPSIQSIFGENQILYIRGEEDKVYEYSHNLELVCDHGEEEMLFSLNDNYIKSKLTITPPKRSGGYEYYPLESRTDLTVRHPGNYISDSAIISLYHLPPAPEFSFISGNLIGESLLFIAPNTTSTLTINLNNSGVYSKPSKIIDSIKYITTSNITVSIESKTESSLILKLANNSGSGSLKIDYSVSQLIIDGDQGDYEEITGFSGRVDFSIIDTVSSEQGYISGSTDDISEFGEKRTYYINPGNWELESSDSKANNWEYNILSAGQYSQVNITWYSRIQEILGEVCLGIENLENYKDLFKRKETDLTLTVRDPEFMHQEYLTGSASYVGISPITADAFCRIGENNYKSSYLYLNGDLSDPKNCGDTYRDASSAIKSNYGYTAFALYLDSNGKWQIENDSVFPIQNLHSRRNPKRNGRLRWDCIASKINLEGNQLAGGDYHSVFSYRYAQQADFLEYLNIVSRSAIPNLSLRCRCFTRDAEHLYTEDGRDLDTRDNVRIPFQDEQFFLLDGNEVTTNTFGEDFYTEFGIPDKNRDTLKDRGWSVIAVDPENHDNYHTIHWDTWGQIIEVQRNGAGCGDTDEYSWKKHAHEEDVMWFIRKYAYGNIPKLAAVSSRYYLDHSLNYNVESYFLINGERVELRQCRGFSVVFLKEDLDGKLISASVEDFPSEVSSRLRRVTGSKGNEYLILWADIYGEAGGDNLSGVTNQQLQNCIKYFKEKEKKYWLGIYSFDAIWLNSELRNTINNYAGTSGTGTATGDRDDARKCFTYFGHPDHGADERLTAEVTPQLFVTEKAGTLNFEGGGHPYVIAINSFGDHFMTSTMAELLKKCFGFSVVQVHGENDYNTKNFERCPYYMIAKRGGSKNVQLYNVENYQYDKRTFYACTDYLGSTPVKEGRTYVCAVLASYGVWRDGFTRKTFDEVLLQRKSTFESMINPETTQRTGTIEKVEHLPHFIVGRFPQKDTSINWNENICPLYHHRIKYGLKINNKYFLLDSESNTYSAKQQQSASIPISPVSINEEAIPEIYIENTYSLNCETIGDYICGYQLVKGENNNFTLELSDMDINNNYSFILSDNLGNKVRLDITGTVSTDIAFSEVGSDRIYTYLTFQTEDAGYPFNSSSGKIVVYSKKAFDTMTIKCDSPYYKINFSNGTYLGVYESLISDFSGWYMYQYQVSVEKTESYNWISPLRYTTATITRDSIASSRTIDCYFGYYTFALYQPYVPIDNNGDNRIAWGWEDGEYSDKDSLDSYRNQYLDANNKLVNLDGGEISNLIAGNGTEMTVTYPFKESTQAWRVMVGGRYIDPDKTEVLRNLKNDIFSVELGEPITAIVNSPDVVYISPDKALLPTISMKNPEGHREWAKLYEYFSSGEPKSIEAYTEWANESAAGDTELFKTGEAKSAKSVCSDLLGATNLTIGFKFTGLCSTAGSDRIYPYQETRQVNVSFKKGSNKEHKNINYIINFKNSNVNTN